MRQHQRFRGERLRKLSPALYHNRKELVNDRIRIHHHHCHNGREIGLLRYQNQQLEEANRNLIDQIEHLHVEIHIAKGDSK